MRVNSSLQVIIAEGFLSRLSFGIISFALPVYAYRRLGLSLAETGLLFSLNLIVEQALKPLMGWVADRWGLKRSFTAAVALRSLVALLLAFAAVPWQLYAVRVLHGVSESLRDPSVSALIAEHADRRAVASSFAWYATAKAVAGSAGKAAGGLLLGLTADNYPSVFFVAFLLSVLPLYVVARYVREGRAGREEADAAPTEAPAAPARGRAGLLPFVILGGLIATTATMLQSLFPVLAMEYGGLSAAQTGLIYALSVAVVLVAGPLFGWLSDNVSHRLVLMVRGLANTVSSLVYLAAPHFAGIAAGSVMDACGKAAFRPAWGALMARMAGLDRRRRARTMSYFGLGEGLGETAGPILAGLLWHAWGVPVMLGARVALALVGEVYALRVTRELDDPRVMPVGRISTDCDPC
ncbi:MAG TPA: MFS transporter [Blastocatellia bacterium]|nr:MFS transporter [Blastocatellia bacterium]